jgi:hypothetical protein
MMKIVLAAAACAVLAGCATPQPPMVNYGHPALNNIQPVYVAVPVYQPAYQPGYQPGYPAAYPQGYSAPGYVQAPSMYADPGRVAAGTILGGIVGSQFGGSPSARIVGAVAGSAIGGSMAAQGSPSGDAVAGAIIGGVVGSRFGQGAGRGVATAIGAGLGSWLAVPRY